MSLLFDIHDECKKRYLLINEDETIWSEYLFAEALEAFSLCTVLIGRAESRQWKDLARIVTSHVDKKHSMVAPYAPEVLEIIARLKLSSIFSGLVDNLDSFF